MASEQQFYGIFALMIGAIALMAWFSDWSSGSIDDDGIIISEAYDPQRYRDGLRFKLILGLGIGGYGLLAVNGVFG